MHFLHTMVVGLVALVAMLVLPALLGAPFEITWRKVVLNNNYPFEPAIAWLFGIVVIFILAVIYCIGTIFV